MNALLKYHWCETSLLSQAVFKHVVPKDFIFKKFVQETGSVSCQLPIPKNFHVMLHYLEKGNFNMWVKCGSHPDQFCGSNGSTDTTRATFNPDPCHIQDGL